MKTLLSILVALSAFSVSRAQTETTDSLSTEQSQVSAADTISLEEVVVSTSRVNNTAGAMRVVPTTMQKETSNNAYSLLAKMALPNVKVDEIANSITMPTALGNLQVRINDIEATVQDLLSLDMAAVRYVDYIRNPGARYGQDVDLVINIVVRRAVAGYSLGASLMQSVTAMTGNDNVYARFNRGKSEFGIDYSLGYSDLDKMRYEEADTYTLPDNSVYTIERKDTESERKSRSHDLQLRYSLADNDRYVFQATLSGSLSHTPCDNVKRKIVTNGNDENVSINTSDRSFSPSLDIYFSSRLTPSQSVTASTALTFIDSDYTYSYGNADTYAYSSSGKTWSSATEALYENRLQKATLTAGVQYNQKYVNNIYTGDTNADNAIRTSSANVFAQARGTLSSLDYNLSLGVSYLYYRQSADDYRYFMFSPRLSLSYPFTKELSLKYDVTATQRPPRLEYLGNVAVRVNEMELSSGNASLHPSKRIEQTLTLALQKPRLYSMISALYRINSDCIMTDINPFTDDSGMTRFLFTRSNQDRVNMLYISNYTNITIVPQKLDFTFNAGINRCFNYGKTYKHHSTSFDVAATLTANIGKFTLTANADSGWGFLENETKSKPSASCYLSLSYSFGNVDLSLYWQDCFKSSKTMFNGELLNRYVSKTMRYYANDYANMISLKLSWRLSKGRKYADVKRTINLEDTDTGVMKKSDIVR
ncbi:MAG: TonB-dependent receptor [Prevotellaceae bacterium]|nr:TonB-dependent receptor [Prevotellaceae bacterium]